MRCEKAKRVNHIAIKTASYAMDGCEEKESAVESIPALHHPVVCPLPVPSPPVGESSSVTPQRKYTFDTASLASYKDVAANPKLFMETLEKLHAKLGTKFMVPTVGGKELDLHQLFMEVTSRGGIDKVIAERRWKEITASFNFPPTATNASFVLRKYYLSLLHNYEQLYFFRSDGLDIISPAPISQPRSSIPSERAAEPHLPTFESHTGIRKRKNVASVPEVPMQLPANYPVHGVIDGKFDHGYLITVGIQGQTLRGVLYHTYRNSSAQPLNNNTNTLTGTRRRKRRRKLSKLDPTHPKPNRSGYNFFFQEQHARLKPLHPGKDREISRMIGELWNKLTESDKAVYQDKGQKDKERYHNEMAEYRERQRASQLVISDVAPLRQRPADPSQVTMHIDPSPKMEEYISPLSSASGSAETESDSELELSDEREGGLESAGMDSTGFVVVPLSTSRGVELAKQDRSLAESDIHTAQKDEDVEAMKGDPSSSR